ncbi:hypothetical protein [Paenibacillus peoriae]|nr:hypothetical protein [Paenibacillus peoriae]
MKHVKENDLVHGEWMRWLRDIDMNHQTAQKFIQHQVSLETIRYRTICQ